ncbi:MAG: hypothetical protein RR792_03220 [Thermomonas sp.]
MDVSLLDLLACPSCRVRFDATVHAGTDDRIDLGFLRCPRCAIVVPVLDGFVMFSEPLLHAGMATAPLLAEMASRLFGTEADFVSYRRDRRQRGVVESYAAFAPFNESTRSIEPVLPHAASALRDGDAILDTWCRTGYSGEWLAGRFPRQRIVSLWEGNSSVLGYRGFRHLLGQGQRARNLDIVFCHLDKPLPFADDAFGMLHAYDTLHRYGLSPLAGECLRVARDDAGILFPHLHLSNSEPEPYFQRGCRQGHGHDYRAWLDQVTATGKRRGWVFSEAVLFGMAESSDLVDDPGTAHYNGMVAILPDQVLPEPVALDVSAPRRFLVNPLFRIHIGRGKVQVDPGLFDGAVGHLLARHPVYAARLPVGPVDVSDAALVALLLAVVGTPESAILAAVSPDSPMAASALSDMTAMELLRPAPISAAAHRLQRFHCNQWPADEDGIATAFWSRIADCSHELLILAEGDGLDGNDLSRFAQATASSLRERGLVAGDWLSVAVDEHPLLLLAAIAAASSGFNVQLCASSTPPHPDSKLFVHADAIAAPSGLAGLPLGLAGGEPSLLSALALAAPGDFMPATDDTGLVEFDAIEGRIRCRLIDLIEGQDSLSAQTGDQLWLVEGSSPLRDVIACLGAWSRLEAARALSSGRH